MQPEARQGWTNWSGGVRCQPDEMRRPADEAEVQAIVRQACEDGSTVRVAGSGHSWTPVVVTDDVLVSLEHLDEVRTVDVEAGQATVGGGITLSDACRRLDREGLALPNLGDVTMQTVAGAFATGTHGTGPAFGNLSETLVGGRLVTGTGDVRTFGPDDEELLHAARVSLGALGIFTELRLDLQRAYKLQRREYCAPFRDAWPHLDDLVADNRNFDLYWYPRSDEVKLRLLNGPGGGTDPRELDYARLVKDVTDDWHRVIPQHNDITRPFEEMEYALPVDDGPDAFLAVRDRVRDRWRADVGWRLLCRTVGADETWLSTEHERDVMTISLLQNAQLEHADYFADLEPLLRDHGGRPHWGKNHGLSADELAELYPRWDDFQRLRRKLDPDDVFVSEAMAELFGVGDTPSAEESP